MVSESCRLNLGGAARTHGVPAGVAQRAAQVAQLAQPGADLDHAGDWRAATARAVAGAGGKLDRGLARPVRPAGLQRGGHQQALGGVAGAGRAALAARIRQYLFGQRMQLRQAGYQRLDGGAHWRRRVPG